MSEKPHTDPKVNEHAQAIGYLCMNWARLDYTLSVSLGRLLGIDDPDSTKVLGINMGLIRKIDAIKAIAFSNRPDDDWYDHMKALLNRISKGDKSLREQRNRYIHDYWYISSEGPVKIQFKAKIQRPQSRQDRQLITTHKAPVSADKIWRCGKDIGVAQIELLVLMRIYVNPEMPPPE